MFMRVCIYLHDILRDSIRARAGQRCRGACGHTGCNEHCKFRGGAENHGRRR